MHSPKNDRDRSGAGLESVAPGVLFGAVIEVPALYAAIWSAGAGHGDYVAARALFPASMLLTLVEGHIGVFAISTALQQFPIYGALVCWSLLRKQHLPIIILASFHAICVLACFSGILPDFS